MPNSSIVEAPVVKQGLTPHEVAAYLGISQRLVRKLIVRGELRAVKLGSVWRISKQAVEALLRGEVANAH